MICATGMTNCFNRDFLHDLVAELAHSVAEFVAAILGTATTDVFHKQAVFGLSVATVAEKTTLRQTP